MRTFTRVGYDEVTSLVVEGAVRCAGRVTRASQALVAQVHGVAVVQQRLCNLGVSGESVRQAIHHTHPFFTKAVSVLVMGWC